LLVLEPQRIKSTERAKQLLIHPAYSLRRIRVYDELQIVVTEVGLVKQTVRAATVVGCAADAGFLCEEAAVLKGIVADRLYCIYWNAGLGCFLNFGA